MLEQVPETVIVETPTACVPVGSTRSGLDVQISAWASCAVVFPGALCAEVIPPYACSVSTPCPQPPPAFPQPPPSQNFVKECVQAQVASLAQMV